MYLIQYTHPQTGNLTHYIVRGYDLRTNRLLPGRIADRTQKGWVMKGSPLTRMWSARGRWVYTLYENPGGYPFIHALDTKRGVAHCNCGRQLARLGSDRRLPVGVGRCRDRRHARAAARGGCATPPAPPP